MQADKQLSTEIDANVPTAARMYDFYLGGKDNYAADREAVGELDKVVPSTRRLALNNRRFLQRVVRVLAEDYGIRQFLDHGSGLPTRTGGSRSPAPDRHPTGGCSSSTTTRWCWSTAWALLDQNDQTAVIHADMRATEEIFSHPDTQRLIDFSQPVAVLFNSVFHCIPDSDTDGPKAVVRRVTERLVPGSFAVMCQLVSEDAEVRKFVTDFMDQATQGHWGRCASPRTSRPFEGMDILEPGLVEVSTWRPDTEVAPRQLTDEWIEFGGLGRLR
ncbi:SAM-dependent methyltransferase [Streptomyces violaceorubidus]